MIRWTKEGKVDRAATLGVIASGALSPSQADRLADVQDQLADALDVAVAELREYAARGGLDAQRVLRQIGADE